MADPCYVSSGTATLLGFPEDHATLQFYVRSGLYGGTVAFVLGERDFVQAKEFCRIVSQGIGVAFPNMHRDLMRRGPKDEEEYVPLAAALAFLEEKFETLDQESKKDARGGDKYTKDQSIRFATLWGVLKQRVSMSGDLKANPLVGSQASSGRFDPRNRDFRSTEEIKAASIVGATFAVIPPWLEHTEDGHSTSPLEVLRNSIYMLDAFHFTHEFSSLADICDEDHYARIRGKVLASSTQIKFRIFSGPPVGKTDPNVVSLPEFHIS